ncbi:MAG: GNAT family N-acetyltransferase [Candidatus Cloacimonadota bacterium]|nr:GNAT family N-acetyltransferase [Candidatus Cloacimonadota bacterium]
MGLATASEYQGKGLATHIAAYTIKKCLHRNIEPVWQCDANYIASVKLAKKLGYILDRKYSAL